MPSWSRSDTWLGRRVVAGHLVMLFCGDIRVRVYMPDLGFHRHSSAKLWYFVIDMIHTHMDSHAIHWSLSSAPPHHLSNKSNGHGLGCALWLFTSAHSLIQICTHKHTSVRLFPMFQQSATAEGSPNATPLLSHVHSHHQSTGVSTMRRPGHSLGQVLVCGVDGNVSYACTM